MDLQEKIARLINPDIPWDEPGDKTGYRWLDWELCGGNRAASRAAARRVELTEDAIGTTQMIYSLQILKAGAILHGQVSLTPAATPAHEEALAAALNLWAPGGSAFLGAKTAVGYGQATITASEPLDGSAVAALTQRTLDHGDDILTVLKDLAR